MEKRIRPDADLPDSPDDEKHLRPEKTILDLPEVKDIPGQENIRVPRLGEFVDNTAASADEEGENLLDEDENAEKDPSVVTALEKADLRKSASQTPGDESEWDVRHSALDETDEDDEPLNEGNLSTDRFGEDMDLPESEEVDEEQ